MLIAVIERKRIIIWNHWKTRQIADNHDMWQISRRHLRKITAFVFAHLLSLAVSSNNGRATEFGEITPVKEGLQKYRGKGKT